MRQYSHRHFALAAKSVLILFLLMGFAMVWLPHKVSQDGILSKSWDTQKGISPNPVASQRKQRIKGQLLQYSPDAFAKFHQTIRTRSGERAPAYPANYQIDELQAAWKRIGIAGLGSKRGMPAQALPWVERGPGNVAGRARAVLIDPTDPTHASWFVGSASGGIWYTSDSGQTWEERTADLPNLAMTTLAMPASNPDIIYAGTGEGFGSFSFVYGQGIWKSSDKGESWTQLESTAGNPVFTNILRLIVNPDDERMLVAATSSGLRANDQETSYLMRSIDGGVNWEAVYTSAARIEQVVASPDNFQVLFATVNGKGVLKSVDGGNTWVSYFDAFTQVGRLELAVAPTNSSLVYVSAQGGPYASTLFRSSDGGTQWEIVADSGDENLDWLQGQGWYNNTIAVDPFLENVVYVGGVDLMRFDLSDTVTPRGYVKEVIAEIPPNTFQLDRAISAPETAIKLTRISRLQTSEFRAIEVRWGSGKRQKAHRFTGKWLSEYQDYQEVAFEVWDLERNQQLMAAYEDTDGDMLWDVSGALKGASERIFILGEPYNPNQPHAGTTVDAFDRAQYVLTVVSDDSEILHGPFPTASIQVLPGIRPFRTGTLERLTYGYGFDVDHPRGVHVDHHHLVLKPTDASSQNFLLLDANDGGLAVSYDKGITFTQTGDTFAQVEGGSGTVNKPMSGLNTAQFYGADKMNGADRYVGGTQDNGNWLSQEAPDGNSSWTFGPGGDGFEAAWHYANPDWIVVSSQFGTFFRTRDGGRSWENISPSGNSPFLSRLAKSNKAPDLLFTVNSSGVVRSSDFGSTWEQVSLPGGWDQTSSPTVRISQATPEVVWAGAEMSDRFTPHVSVDGGQTFAPVNAYANLGPLTDIATHPSDSQVAYALFSMSSSPKILRTTDLGQSWEDISGVEGGTSLRGFPDVAVYSLLVMPHDDQVIWAGTEIGLFISEDGGESWVYGDTGLPAVSIWQMRIVNDQVVVATHGRGVWTVTLPELTSHTGFGAVPPLLRSIKGGRDGKLRIAIDLPVTYDSIHVYVDDIHVGRLASTTALTSEELDVSIAAEIVRKVAVEARGYVAGAVYTSATKRHDVFPLLPAQPLYESNFGEDEADFLLDGFSIVQAAGFSGPALHSPHPYKNAQDLTAQLMVPVLIASPNTSILYDEVVRIEPAHGPGTSDGDLFDYVSVEGSNDGGLNWRTLAPGYDSRYVGFEGDVPALRAVPGPDAATKHVVPITNIFEVGEEILIRFRLVSDHTINGWGWAIDNLRIMDALPTGVEKARTGVFSLAQNYPNPFNADTRIHYELAADAVVRLAIYDMVGREVRVLVSDIPQPPGSFYVDWDGRNQAGHPVASGMYVYRLKAGHTFTHSRMLVRLR